MHRLLKRQLKKLYGEIIPEFSQLLPLLDVVDGTYLQFQDDYNKLERILELSSKESFKELSNFKNAIDTAALVSLADIKGEILSANENFCKISGYTISELIGKKHNEFKSGIHPDAFWKEMWQTINSGKIWQAEVCNRNKTGALYWVDTTIIPFLNDEGKPYQFLSIRFDITRRKKIEEEIKTLALVAQKTQNAVIISDLSGKAIWANAGFERITGYQVEELIGKRPGSLLQGPDTDPNTVKAISEALKSASPYTGEILNYSKSGKEYWISISITPLIDDDKHIGYISIETDITERKNFESQLKENDQLLRAINAAAGELLKNSNFNNAIGNAIRIMGEAFRADRVHIFKNNKNQNGEIDSFSQRFVWDSASDEIKIDIPEAQDQKYEDLGLERWKEEFEKNLTIVAKIDQLPEKEMVSFRNHNLKCVVALPIMLFDEFWGFISLDSSTRVMSWKENNEQILRNFAGTIGSAFERYESEIRLRENEEKFRLLIESATDIFYYTDHFGNFTYVNDIATQITGFSTSELLKMNYLDLVEKSYRPEVKAFYNRQSLESKKVTYNEFPIRTKNGKTAWIGQNVQLILTEGKKMGIQAIAREITNLKNAQMEIENSHNFLNEIIDSIPNPLFVKNRKHQWVIVNNAYSKLTGIPKSKISGQTETDFLDIQDATDFISQDTNQFESGEEKMREVTYVTPEGDEKILLVKKTIFSNQGKDYLIAVITDITEIKEREKEIILYNKISDQISDAISVADYNGTLIYVNESHARNIGKSKNELIGSSIVQMEKIFETIDLWHNHYDEVKQKGEILIEGQNIRSDGTVFPVEASVKYVRIENKGYIVAAIRDITDRLKNEEEVRNLKVFYETVLNKIPAEVVVFDNNHKYLFVNETAVKDPEKRAWLHGHTDREYGIHFNKQPEIAENREKLFNKVIEIKGQFGFEEKLSKPDGSYIWLLRRFFPILDPKGDVQNVIGFGLDITERVLAEERTKESEDRLKLATKSANLGIWDWQIKENKLIWDDSMYYIFGVDPSRFSNDYEAFEKTLHPEDKERVNEELGKSLSEGHDFKSVFRIINDAGDVHYITAFSKTFRDEKNEPYRLIGVNYDVTETVLTQQKMIKQQEDLEEAQHIAKVARWEIDVNERRITWSREMFHICEMATGNQPNLTETYAMFTPETRENVMSAFFNALENLKEFEIEAQLVTGKGSIVDIKLKGIPHTENGKVQTIRGIFQDVTREKEASRLLIQYTEELEKKNKELDQFAYVVSHDLKAPLRGINNLSLWIEEDLEGKLEGDTKTNLDLMRKRVKRMEGLIDGILQYSRAGRIKHDSVGFSLKDALDDMINSMSPPEKFKINIQEDLPYLITEKIAIEQVFANYISNAIKYNNNPEPVIDISYRTNGKFYEFCVADNGPGIEKEYHEKVFVIFQTLQARDTFESTGVGLAIVKKMVEDKGGRVWIESEKGHGSKFYFSWPVNESEE